MPATDPLYSVRDGHLCFDGADLVELADASETPFFVFSERRLRANIEAVLGSFRREHAATEVFYASKACSNLWFLRVVRDAGANVEVNAGGELEKALAVGFEPADRLQRGREDPRRDRARSRLRRARLHGRFAPRAGRIGEVAASMAAVAAVAPRIDVHVPTLTHPGFDCARRQGRHRRATTRRRRSASPPRIPTSTLPRAPAHRFADYQRGVPAGDRRALDLVDEVEAAAGIRLRFVNAGGGFAVPYREAPVTCHPATTSVVAHRCRLRRGGRRRRRRSTADLALFLEPGRSIAATTAVLVARVENEKVKGRRNGAGRRIGDERWVTVDAGFNTLLDAPNYAWYYRTIVASRAGEEADTDFASPARFATAATCSPATPTRRTGGSRRRPPVERGRLSRCRRLHAGDDASVQRAADGRRLRDDDRRRLVHDRRRDTAADLVAHDVLPR